jgi:hypothetical protein
MHTNRIVSTQFSKRPPSHVPIHTSVILYYALLFSALEEQMKSFE